MKRKYKNGAVNLSESIIIHRPIKKDVDIADKIYEVLIECLKQ